MSTTTSTTHLAAILAQAKTPFVVEHRPTPTPGPTDLLIAVKAIALNPIDHYQRDLGFPPLAAYPAILGSDIAGTVLAAGAAVPASAPAAVGARVAAFAPAFFAQGAPDYGGLQSRVLVPAANAAALPDAMGWTDAAVLPMAVFTAWAGWRGLGLGPETRVAAAAGRGVLVWGASSSVGSAAVQTARGMGLRVYAVASRRHHGYIKSLGARRVFEYKEGDVVREIVRAVKEDGVTVRLGYDAVGALQQCLDVLEALKGDGASKLATTVPLKEESPKAEGVETTWVEAPREEKERDEFFRTTYNVWLKEKLQTGEFVPSPKVQVIEGGLEAANKGLDELKKGVSGTKLVLEL